MEIGSFIELDLRNTGEFYEGEHVLRLNSARAGIYHACKLYDVSSVFIPYYQCNTVGNFLAKQGLTVHYYHINDRFEPIGEPNALNSAWLIVNYFGILSNQYLSEISKKYNNIIIDNAPAFFNNPIENSYNIYSTRKFFGVPDGCYVIGSKAQDKSLEYGLDESSEMAGFLLKRIEKGCSAVYADRMKNEERIDNSGILKMSKLTQALLANVDYAKIAQKRRRNFFQAHKLYHSINLIDPLNNMDDDCVPMVYPLVIEQEDLVRKLADRKIYTGRWWHHVLALVEAGTFEAYMSKFMIPIPIDQRYGDAELHYTSEIVFELLHN